MADSSSAALRSSTSIASAHLQGVARGEEFLECGVDLILAGDRYADEVFVFDRAERGHQRAERPPTAFLDLAVAEDVRALQELTHQVQAALIVDLAPVVAIREVERIDVPLAGIEALFDDLERELVGRRYLRAARLAEVEEGVLVHLLGLGVVGEEDDPDVVVLRPQESNHPEIEAAGDVLLELAHR